MKSLFYVYITKLIDEGLSDSEIHNAAMVEYPLAAGMHTRNAINNIRQDSVKAEYEKAHS